MLKVQLADMSITNFLYNLTFHSLYVVDIADHLLQENFIKFLFIKTLLYMKKRVLLIDFYYAQDDIYMNGLIIL